MWCQLVIIVHQKLYWVKYYSQSDYCSQNLASVLLDNILWDDVAGLGWNYPCDLWSAGCILVELCSVSAFLSVWLPTFTT
jgi:hypothetical protein